MSQSSDRSRYRLMDPRPLVNRAASKSPKSPPSVLYDSRPSSDGSVSQSPPPSTSHSPPSAERGFTPFSQLIQGGTGSAVLGNASTGLEALKSVLEAVDTLPFVKYLASVGIQLLQYVIVRSSNSNVALFDYS